MTVARRACPIGVVGGYGAVGRAAIAQLVAWGVGPVVVAGRDPTRARVVLDLDDRPALERFCAHVQVVVNCAGPSCVVLDRVARAARATNAHYVDGGGDDPVYDLLMGDGDEQAAVLSAGMLPGLTGLLPRALAASELDEPSRMTGYVGGRDRFTFTAATDYLASLQNGFGRSSAVWRNGQRVERALTPLVDAQLPFFPEPVAAYPYLSTEMERLARRLRLAELTFFNVFPSSHVRATLNELASAEPNTNAGALVAASELDLFGREPYQRLVFQLDGSGHDQADAPTMVLSGRSASQLTGAMVALAAVAVLEGRVPPGVHFAADVLDPAWGVARLREAGAVLALDVFNGSPPGSGQLEEGVL